MCRLNVSFVNHCFSKVTNLIQVVLRLGSLRILSLPTYNLGREPIYGRDGGALSWWQAVCVAGAWRCIIIDVETRRILIKNDLKTFLPNLDYSVKLHALFGWLLGLSKLEYFLFCLFICIHRKGSRSYS